MAEVPGQGGTPPGGSGAPSVSDDPSKQGQGNRLIAGKYKSVEDALDGMGELIKAHDETRQEIGAVRQLLERALTADPGSVPVGQGGRGGQGQGQGYVDPYARGAQQMEEIDSAEFITQPGRVLARREQALESRLTETVVRTTSAILQNALAVEAFKRDNPDLRDHEPIVSHFMRQSDPNRPIHERLRDAGKSAREYVAKIKQGGQASPAGREPGPGEYVEGPASEGGRAPAPGGQGAAEEGEEALVDYIKGRNNERAERVGIKV